MAMDPRNDTGTTLRSQFRLLVAEKAAEQQGTSFKAADLTAPRLSFADETVEIRYVKDYLDVIVVTPVEPPNSCPYESEDLIVIVWMETLCFMFENPITTTIVSASTVFLLLLGIGGCMGGSYKGTGRLCCPVCRCCTQMGKKCCGCLKCCRCCRCCRCCIVELVEEIDDEVFVSPTRWCDCSCCCEKSDESSPDGSSGSMGILVRGRSKAAKDHKVVPVAGRTVHAPVEIVYAMHDFEDVSLGEGGDRVGWLVWLSRVFFCFGVFLCVCHDVFFFFLLFLILILTLFSSGSFSATDDFKDGG